MAESGHRHRRTRGSHPICQQASVGSGQPMIRPKESERFDTRRDGGRHRKAAARISRETALAHVAAMPATRRSIRDWKRHTSPFDNRQEFRRNRRLRADGWSRREIPDIRSRTIADPSQRRRGTGAPISETGVRRPGVTPMSTFNELVQRRRHSHGTTPAASGAFAPAAMEKDATWSSRGVRHRHFAHIRSGRARRSGRTRAAEPCICSTRFLHANRNPPPDQGPRACFA